MNRTFPKLFNITLFLILSFSIKANESEKDHFSLLPLPTVMDRNMDAWYKIPQNSGPRIYNVSNVFRGQEFSIQVFFNHYGIIDNQVDISYDVSIFDPKGNKTKDSRSDIIGAKGPWTTSSILILSEQFLVVSFTEDDQFGTYKVELTANDNLTNKTATSEFDISLIPFEPESQIFTGEKVSKWMTNYYEDSKPELALEVVKQIVEADLDWVNEHLLTITFLNYIYSNNEFLWKYVDITFDQMPIKQQKNFILLDALSSEPNLIKKRPELKAEDTYNWASKVGLPTLTSDISNAYQMDAKWALFFASGKIEPIISIIETFELHKSLGTIEKLKAGSLERNQTTEKLAYDEALLNAAIWSLKSNSTSHPLIFKYAAWIYQNTDMSLEAKGILYSVLKAVQQEMSESKSEDSSG